jgi:tetrahydromethanopterin S-methyltransferase subunit F
MVTVTPASPDNKSIREQLEEMKKLNASTGRHSKIIIGIALTTLVVSVIGVIVALLR